MYRRSYRSADSRDRGYVPRRFNTRYDTARRRRYTAPPFSTRYYGPRRSYDRPWARDRYFMRSLYSADVISRIEEDERVNNETEENNRVPEEEVEKLEVLTVKELDLEIKSNALRHRTSRFHCVKTKDNQPVLRRGQEFTLTLTFNRKYLKEKDDLHFVFDADSDAPTKNLQASFTLDETKKNKFKGESDWGARILSKSETDENELKVAVYIPGNCVVGEWELQVRTTLVGSKDDYIFIYPKPVSILFNPWSEDDQVYMKEEDDLKEYILNEAGTVFTGTSDRVGSRKWEYGQFEEGILQVCFTILRKAFGFKVTPAMANPVEVSRALTRAVNSSDDDGVLAGNWSGDYEGGTAPWKWTDSTAILKEYEETKKPVRYGQCWVFSHVLTAVCRALGLPCRSVTNFDSAHDTDNTCTIDRYYDNEGNKLRHMGSDSVWNFHVWNEVWMLRPDLPSGYDGWHCIDATPQEQSLGVFQCGPCPVAAVKRGDIHIGYDTAFVFAEVNADIINWIADSLGDDVSKWKYSSIDKKHVGDKISTKNPDGRPTPRNRHLRHGRRDDTKVRLDLTDTYKFVEGTEEERKAVMRALRFTRHGEHLFKKSAKLDVEFLDSDDTMVGHDLVVKVKVKNISKEDRRVTMVMTSRATRYWDHSETNDHINKESFDEVTMKPGSEETYSLTIPAEQYLSKSDMFLMMFVYACARDVEEEMPYSTQKPFRLRRPDLDVDGPEKAKSGEVLPVTISFTNPLAATLTECKLQMGGSLQLAEKDPRFTRNHHDLSMKHEDVPPGKAMKVEVKLVGYTEEDVQERGISIVFMSKELEGVYGGYDVEIHKA